MQRLAQGQSTTYKADIIDHTDKVAIASKTVSSSDASRVVQNVVDGVDQLQGRTNEIAPPGYGKRVEVSLKDGAALSTANRETMLAELQRALPEATLKTMQYNGIHLRVQSPAAPKGFTFSPDELGAGPASGRALPPLGEDQ